MKPLRLFVEFHLSPAQVKKLIDLASENVTRPEQLSDLDRRQLVRCGVRVAVAKALRKAG